MFLTKIKLANLVTYIGMITSLFAIIFAFDNNIKFAFICFIISGICDMLDGKFARIFKRTDMEKEIGIQMDSLADVMSFLIVPVAISLGMGMNRWYNIIVYIMYIVLGITRLGYFNVFANEKKRKNEDIEAYQGVAVTYSSLVFPIVYLLKYIVNENIFKMVFIIVMFMMSILFVLNIKVSKPGKKAYIVYSLLAIAVTVLIVIL